MPMTGYWWECQNPNCAAQQKMPGKEVVQFLWKLADSDWNQMLLSPPCADCGESKRLTYEFPASHREKLSVLHVVGFKDDVSYLPMMWETMPSSGPEHWFDFKYVGGLRERNPDYGLSKPAVFTREKLRRLFTLYRNKTSGDGPFP